MRDIGAEKVFPSRHRNADVEDERIHGIRAAGADLINALENHKETCTDGEQVKACIDAQDRIVSAVLYSVRALTMPTRAPVGVGPE